MTIGLKLILIGAIVGAGAYGYLQVNPDGVSTRVMCKYDERVSSNRFLADTMFELNPNAEGTPDRMFDNLMIGLRGDFHRETRLDFDSEWGKWVWRIGKTGSPC